MIVVSNIEGIKYVEFTAKASGFGVVNHNGNFDPDQSPNRSKEGGKNSDYENMVFPKKRGGQLYISNNCLRAHLFQDDARGFSQMERLGHAKNLEDKVNNAITLTKPELSQRLGVSFLGLLRGYMLTEKGGEAIARETPLILSDFVNSTQNVNKQEVGINHLARDESGKASNSFYLSETWGDTEYDGKGAISIQKLQFISLDNRFGRCAISLSTDVNIPKEDEVKNLIDELLNNLVTIGEQHDIDGKGAKVEYGIFQKKGALFKCPEVGLLLNDIAIDILVAEMMERISSLEIIKGKGYMSVNELNVRFNENDRFLVNEPSGREERSSGYAQYYEKVEDL